MLILVSFCLLQGSVPAIAEETVSDSQEMIMYNLETEQRIQELFSLRGALETDIAGNAEEIQIIDYELARLGVETISSGELLVKIAGDAAPAADFTSTDEDTIWTSRRTVVTYRGQHYELQIIEGVPGTDLSHLLANNAQVKYDSKRVVAGATEILKIVGTSLLGMTPITEFSSAITLIAMMTDVADAYQNSIEETTVINAVSGVAYISESNHIKYVFVKGYGSGDNYQKLGYVGNYLTVNFSTIISEYVPNGEHGLKAVHVANLNNEATVVSEYFYDYSVALLNYYNYRNNIDTEYVCEYWFQSIRVEVLEKEEIIKVPMTTLYITIPTEV